MWIVDMSKKLSLPEYENIRLALGKELHEHRRKKDEGLEHADTREVVDLVSY